MPTAAFVLALLSLVMATLSLGWQISMWVLTAGRPRVRLKHGIATAGGNYLGEVDQSGAPADLRSLSSQGISGEEVIGVEVANVGRNPLIISGCSLGLEGGKIEYRSITDVIGAPFPHTIDPGTRATWLVPMERASRLAYATEGVGTHRNRAHMSVETGLGRKVQTKTAVDLAEARRRNGHEVTRGL